jgi:hypothetical protein
MSTDIEERAYHELCAYTLTLGDATFIHQHVVDAFAAQRAHEHSKPISVAFSVLGLYLHVEKHWSGRQVQRAHMAMARRKHDWPVFTLPVDRGAITSVEVMAMPAGERRNAAIHAWCASVWKAYEGNREQVVRMLAEHGIQP